jgi:hypothetical protein
MLKIEQGFGFAIAFLLLDVIADCVAPKMPNHCSRAEADLVSLVLESPTDIDVVAGGAEQRIESIDGF